MKNPASYATSQDGTRIAYDVTGTGPVLIYITGATCFRNFFPIRQDVKTFSKSFTVYNYDRRGRGDSGDNSANQPWTLDREVDDIEALIEAAGGQAILYGHSSGAVLALEAALRLSSKPSKVVKVVVYDAPYVHDEKEKREYGLLGDRVNVLIHQGKNASAVKTFLQGIGMPKAFVWLMPLFPGWKTMKALAPTLAYDIALTRDVPPLEKFKGIAVPVAVLAGGKSPGRMQDVAKGLAGAIPGARLEILEKRDHMVPAGVIAARLA